MNERGGLTYPTDRLEGINVSVYYSTIIFSHVGLSPFLSQLLAAVMNTAFAIGAWCLPATIELFGRRRILMFSAAGLTVCLTIFVAMIGLPNPTLATQWTAVAFAFVYNFIFGFGWIGVAWLYGPEVVIQSHKHDGRNSLTRANSYTQIAPLKFRHVSGAASAFGEWLFSFITVFAGGIGLQTVGWKMWLWYLLSCAAAVPFVYFFCPETTGKSLEEIDFLFKVDDTDDIPVVVDEVSTNSEKEQMKYQESV